MSQEGVHLPKVNLGMDAKWPQKTRAVEELSACNAFSVFSKATFCIGSDRAPFQNNLKERQKKQTGLSTDT